MKGWRRLTFELCFTQESGVAIQGDSKLFLRIPWPINGNPDSNLESTCN
jgi:hypothetical protein